jgi:UDP:flavonoid glycosyltransferase YjiC (YdhE family)
MLFRGKRHAARQFVAPINAKYPRLSPMDEGSASTTLFDDPIPASVRMTRILMAWQHGQNFGHWARLSAVARSAATAGAFPILAVPESHAQTLPQSGSTDIVARSPRPQPNVRATQPQSFADVLISLGYAQPETLAPVLHWWLTLLARLKIDRVVLDYAPAAQWAAQCLGIPAMQITNGFDGPPPTCPTFKFGMRGPMLERRNAKHIAQLDECFATVAQSLHLPASPTLAGLLAYPFQVHDCIEEVDPYAPRSHSSWYVGPMGLPERLSAAAWPDKNDRNRQPKVLAYLRGAALRHAVLDALTQPALGIQARVVCISPDATRAEVDQWRTAGVTLSVAPAALEPLLASCDAVVSYGAAALTCQAALAGLPQLLLPADSEKRLMAERLAGCGAAITLPARSDAAAVARALSALLGDGDVRAAAQAIASRYRAGHLLHAPDDVIRHFVTDGQRVDGLPVNPRQ